MKLELLLTVVSVGVATLSGHTVVLRPHEMLCDASDMTDIVGYTAIASTNVAGEFEGADFDKPVKLDNGMIFEFTEYNYTYSYRPDVIIFARAATIQGRSFTAYKLMIEDELYDAIRIR